MPDPHSPDAAPRAGDRTAGVAWPPPLGSVAVGAMGWAAAFGFVTDAVLVMSCRYCTASCRTVSSAGFDANKLNC